MFKKSEQAEATAQPSIEELAQAVKDNEARVLRQRKAIEDKIEELKKDIQNPTTVKAENIDSFDISEIENNTKPSESREGLAVKMHALEIALDRPMCCDKEYLQTIRQYLEAIRSVVEELEAKQYEKIHLTDAKKAEAERYCNEQTQEYAEADQQIESMLRVAHLTHIGKEYEKRIPMNGLWGIATNLLVKDLIDDAIKSCDDGRRYDIYGNFPHAAPTLCGSATFGFNGF